jgi:hypothetical protein
MKSKYLTILLVLTSASGCGRQATRPYVGPAPRVGDRAIVRIEAGSSFNANNGKIRVGKTIDATVACTQAAGRKRSLTVYRTGRNHKSVPWYRVSVDYDAVSVEGRVAVYRLDGRRIPAGEPIDGWPVPFHYWLNVDGSRFSSAGTIAEQLGDSRSVLLRVEGSGNGRRKVRLEVLGKKRPVVRPDIQEFQEWIDGEWLWAYARRNRVRGEASSAAYEEFSAVRRSPPRPDSDAF